MGEFVPKNGLFYRRTGALWTDLYHTPPERLHLVNHRPDLDKKHEAHVTRRMSDEARREAVAKAEKVKFRKRRQLHMARRRKHNRDVEACTSTASKSKIVGTVDGVTVKDWTYYRRQGFMWSDLAHTPEGRLHLVVNPWIIEADERARDFIARRHDEERFVEDAVANMRKDRIDEIRGEFRERLEHNRRSQTMVRGATAIGMTLDSAREVREARMAQRSQSAGAAVRGQSASSEAGSDAGGAGGGGGGTVGARGGAMGAGGGAPRPASAVAARRARLAQLAQPRKLHLASDPRFETATPDHTGLLCADPVIMERVATEVLPLASGSRRGSRGGRASTGGGGGRAQRAGSSATAAAGVHFARTGAGGDAVSAGGTPSRQRPSSAPAGARGATGGGGSAADQHNSSVEIPSARYRDVSPAGHGGGGGGGGDFSSGGGNSSAKKRTPRSAAAADPEGTGGLPTPSKVVRQMESFERRVSEPAHEGAPYSRHAVERAKKDFLGGPRIRQ